MCIPAMAYNEKLAARKKHFLPQQPVSSVFVLKLFVCGGGSVPKNRSSIPALCMLEI